MFTEDGASVASVRISVISSLLIFTEESYLRIERRPVKISLKSFVLLS